MRSRRGLGEVAGSLSMLAITIALLSGASFLAVGSIKGAETLMQGSSQEQQRQAGVMISVLGVQSNSSGTFVWLYDYGWESAPVQAVYANGRPVQFSSTCPGDWAGSLCTVSLATAESGELTIIIGGESIAASV